MRRARSWCVSQAMSGPAPRHITLPALHAATSAVLNAAAAAASTQLSGATASSATTEGVDFKLAAQLSSHYRLEAVFAADIAARAQQPDAEATVATLRKRLEAALRDTTSSGTRAAQQLESLRDGGATRSDAPVVLLAVVAPNENREPCVNLFCPVEKRVLICVRADAVGEFDAMSLLEMFGGRMHFVMIPISGEQVTMLPVQKLAQHFTNSGFGAHARTSFDEIMSTLVAAAKIRAPRESGSTRESSDPWEYFMPNASRPDPAASLVERCVACWNLIAAGTRECNLGPYKTIDAAAFLTMTPADVYIIRLAHSGANSHHLSLYNVATGATRSASGTMHDILAELLAIPSTSVILVRTPFCAAHLVYAARVAMCKRPVKTAVHIILPSAVDDDKGKEYAPRGDGISLVRDMAKACGWSSHEEFVWRSRVACAKQLREQLTKPDSFINNNYTAQRTAEAQKIDFIVTQKVSDYLARLVTPERVAAEAAEMRRFGRCCYVVVHTAKVSKYRRFDNPLVDDNYVVAAAFMADVGAPDGKPAVILPLNSGRSRAQQAAFPELDGVDTLVLNNAKHVLLFFWRDANLQAFLRRGGRVWCTMFGEYLLSGQRTQFPDNSLPHTASLYGVELPAADASGAPSDAELKPTHSVIVLHDRMGRELAATEVVFRMQVDRALRQSQLLSLSHRMDAMLAMAEMEFRGVSLNRTAIADLVRDERNELVATECLLQNCVPELIPLDLHRYFSWSSPAHLEALFFGGTLRLAAQEPDMVANSTSIVVELLFEHERLDTWANAADILTYAREKGLSLPISDLNREHLVASVVRQLREQARTQRVSFRIVVFDLETTGLNCETDEIVELCFIDPITGDKFSALINPKIPIPPEVTDIHNITQEMVATAPTIADAIPGLLRFLRLTPETAIPGERVLLMSHFVMGLDMPLLRRAVHRVHPHFKWDRVAFVDSYAMFKHQPDTFRESLSLGSLLAEYGVETSGELHRADADVLGLWNCLVRAFGNRQTEPQRAHREILAAMANDIATNPKGHCMAGLSYESVRTASVELPGLFHKHFGGEAAVAALPTFDDGTTTEDAPSKAAKTAIPAEAKKKGTKKRGSAAAASTASDASPPPTPKVTAESRARDKLLRHMKQEGVSKTTLTAFAERGCVTAELLLRVQELTRGKGGLLDSDRRGELVYLYNEDSCVHQDIGLWSTTTSRTVSTSPSCQNLPKDDKSPLRKAFSSRFGSEGFVVEVDYKQLEIAIMAVLSEDEGLLRDLRNGVDFHARRVPFFRPGLTYEMVMQRLAAKDPEMVALRRKAKTVSFQRLYGGGVDTIARTTKLPKDVVQRLIDEEDAMYPGIRRYHELVRAVALRAGNPGLPTGYIFELPTGCRMTFSHTDITRNLPPVKNYPIQGYGAELVQMMLGRLFRRYARKNFYDGKVCLVNFVHDSVWLDVHQSVVEAAVRDCAGTLSAADEYVAKAFPGVTLGMPLGVTAEFGRTMADLKDAPSEWLNPAPLSDI